MKVLYLVSDGPCRHDYGVDNLMTGFFNVCGFENVYDFPEKECVHLSSMEERDFCQISSDACYPYKNHRIEDIAKHVDLVVLTAPDPRLYTACSYISARIPVVGVDFGDALGNFRQPYERVANRPLAMYYKRELPLGQSFASPMPLSFPVSRVPDPMPAKTNRVHYWATSHGGGDPGKPRLAIAWALATALSIDPGGRLEYGGGTVRIENDKADVWLTPGQAKGTRPSPEEYYERMATCLVGIAYNGALNWDNMRFHENFAFGLAQVSERPRNNMLNAPEDGKHCLYVDTPEQVVPKVMELLKDEPRAREIARAGHEHWAKHLSSERQAERIIEAVGKKGA